MVSIASLANPYNYAHPVSDSDLFVGRQSELDDIRYYLDNAQRADPIHVAILGPRASGKTSFLNMTQQEAARRGFCTARVDLDTSDASTQMAFFFKLFDSVLSAACESGAYGGKNARTYDTYLDTVYTYQIPEDKEFSPFLFPLLYAKALGSGNPSAPVADQAFTTDLRTLSAALQHPVAILVDECNVLINNIAILQKLRNMLQNLRGYMLVLTGTPDLFPVMDEVFSPIGRQFAKISIGEFRSIDDTEACMKRPIEKLHLSFDDLFRLEDSRSVVREVHNLASGRPYEVQFICHTMFKRLQQGRANSMRLDWNVIEDMRRQLQSAQDIGSRPVLSRVHSLSKSQLKALSTLSRCNGEATFDELWILEYIIYGNKRWQKAELERHLDFFMSAGILHLDAGRIRFVGDDFDQIYTKYYAHEQGVFLSLTQASPDIVYRVQLLAVLSGDQELLEILPWWTSDTRFDILRLANRMSDPAVDDDVLAGAPIISRQIYELMLDHYGQAQPALVEFHVAAPGASGLGWAHAHWLEDAAGAKALATRMRPISERARSVGAVVKARVVRLPHVDLPVITNKVERSESQSGRRLLAEFHLKKMVDTYVKQHDAKLAAVHADLACRYGGDLDTDDLNNMGYLYMSLGDDQKAIAYLSRAAEIDPCKRMGILAEYNLGIAKAKQGQLRDAQANLERCLEQASRLPKLERECFCLYIPRYLNGELIIEEVMDPDLAEAAMKAHAAVAAALLDKLDLNSTAYAPSFTPPQ